MKKIIIVIFLLILAKQSYCQTDDIKICKDAYQKAFNSYRELKDSASYAEYKTLQVKFRQMKFNHYYSKEQNDSTKMDWLLDEGKFYSRDSFLLVLSTVKTNNTMKKFLISLGTTTYNVGDQISEILGYQLSKKTDYIIYLWSPNCSASRKLNEKLNKEAYNGHTIIGICSDCSEEQRNALQWVNIFDEDDVIPYRFWTLHVPFLFKVSEGTIKEIDADW